MVMVYPFLTEDKVWLLPSIRRNTDNCPKNLRHPFRLDWDSKIEVFLDEDNDSWFPFSSFHSIQEVESWITENWDWLDEGRYYLMARAEFTHGRPMRRKRTRLFGESAYKVGRPRRLRQRGKWNGFFVIAKFEMFDSECVKVFEKREYPKHVPYTRRRYYLSQLIESNHRKLKKIDEGGGDYE